MSAKGKEEAGTSRARRLVRDITADVESALAEAGTSGAGLGADAASRADRVMRELPEDEWVDGARTVAAQTGSSLFDVLTYMSTAIGAAVGADPITTTATVSAIRAVWSPLSRILARIPGSRTAATYLQRGDRFINQMGGAGAVLGGAFLAVQMYNWLSGTVVPYLFGRSDVSAEEQQTIQESVTKLETIISKERPQMGGGNAGQQQIDSAYIANADGAIKRAQAFTTYNVRNNRASAVTRPLISNERVMFAGY